MAKKRRTELDIDDTFDVAPEPVHTLPIPPPPVVEHEGAFPEMVDEEAPPKPKVNKIKLLILSAVGLALLLVTALIIYLAVTIFFAMSEKKPEPPPPPKKEEPVKPLDLPKTYEFDPFIIPVGQGDAKAVVKISFTVKMNENDVLAMLDNGYVLIRESVLFFLKSKPVEYYRDTGATARLGKDITGIINLSTRSGAIAETYVTDLTLQSE